MNKKAFSLVELSIVLLIIGVIIAGITSSSLLIDKARLRNARSITQSSPINSIKNLSLWLEPTMENAFATGTTSFTNIDVPQNSQAIGRWNNMNNHVLSPEDNSPSQASSAVQPLYIKNAINNLPALRFNGTSNYLLFSNLNMLENSSGLTAFFCCRHS